MSEEKRKELEGFFVPDGYDGCLICKRVDDAMQEISRIVLCRDCIYFEPPKETRWGWCRNSRCHTLPNGFCDEGLRKEKAE